MLNTNRKPNPVKVPSADELLSELVLNCNVPLAEFQLTKLMFENNDGENENKPNGVNVVLPVRPEIVSDGLQEENRGIFIFVVTVIVLN